LSGFERVQRRRVSEVSGLLSGLDEAPFFNARALSDPLTGGVHPLREIIVGYDEIRNAHAGTDNLCSG
jgi:hypothetical protein